MTTNVQISGSTGGQDNLWKDIKDSTGVNVKTNIDFSNLSGDLALGSYSDSDNYTSVGGFIKSDLQTALLNAGYIKKSECPTPTPTPTPTPSGPTDCKKNLWNGLSIVMTCVAGLFLVIILIMLTKKKAPIKK